MIANPAIFPAPLAISTIVSGSLICFLTLAGVQRQLSPYSMCSRDREAMILASEACAERSVMLVNGFMTHQSYDNLPPDDHRNRMQPPIYPNLG